MKTRPRSVSPPSKAKRTEFGHVCRVVAVLNLRLAPDNVLDTPADDLGRPARHGVVKAHRVLPVDGCRVVHLALGLVLLVVAAQCNNREVLAYLKQ